MDALLNVNGFEVSARYPDETVSGVLIPLLKRLTAMQREKGGRLIVLLAAPPATGKSTLAVFLERLSRETPGCAPVQALGMDGFHYPQKIILARTVLRDGREIPMKQVKGAPDTFDAAALRRTLEAARTGNPLWPAYDRRLHDVVADAIAVEAPVLLIEGNWLLLDDDAWRGLPCDFSLFVRAEEAQLRSRLIDRKMRGGLSRSEAEAFYERCDGPNVRLCLSRSLPADLTLRMNADGGYLPDETKGAP